MDFGACYYIENDFIKLEFGTQCYTKILHIRSRALGSIDDAFVIFPSVLTKLCFNPLPLCVNLQYHEDQPPPPDEISTVHSSLWGHSGETFIRFIYCIKMSKSHLA